MNKIYLAVIGIVAVLGMGVMFLGADDSSAEEIIEPTDSGTCGTNVTWEWYADTKTLIIGGTGTSTAGYSDTSNAPWYNYRTDIETVLFDNPNLTTLGYYLFYNCTSLKNIELPNTITEISNYAFYKCSGLTSITIPTNVTYIGRSAFATCSNLESVVWNATSMTTTWSSGNYIFVYCDNIREITIGENVTKIATDLFSTPQTSTPVILNWNATIMNIGASNSMFSGRNITTVNIGENVQYIPAYFSYSFKNVVTTINLSNSVTRIYTNAFQNVPNLNDKLILPNTVLGYYTDDTFTTKANLSNGQIGYGAIVQSINVDPAYNVDDESFNFENVTATMNVSGTDYDLVPEYAIYPTDYTTGTDSGMAGKLLKTIPVFVALALLMGIVVAVRSRMD